MERGGPVVGKEPARIFSIIITKTGLVSMFDFFINSFLSVFVYFRGALGSESSMTCGCVISARVEVIGCL
jgi:hypothetical protein